MKTVVLAASLVVTSLLIGSLAACGGDSTSATTTDGSTGNPGDDDACRPENLPSPFDCEIAKQVHSDCVALQDYSDSQLPTLRIAQLKINAPSTLGNNPLVQGTVVDGAVTMNLPQCNLGVADPSSQSGNFNLLLQFDLQGKKLKAGAAHPTLDPLGGYSFANETIDMGTSTFQVKPIDLDMTLTGNNFEVSQGADLTLPIYQDKSASTVILLPLHKTRITNGTLSADHNCIGALDFKNLSPGNNCTLTEPFVGGASLDGFITLEEADQVDVTQAMTTLCALLASEGQNPKCTRDGDGKIAFLGDWCSTTDTAGGCQDAVKMSADFAASAVKLNN